MAKPAWVRHGDQFAYTLEEHGIRAQVDMMYEARETCAGDLLIQTIDGAHLLWRRVNLFSTQRGPLIKELRHVHQDVPWEEVLEQIFTITIREWRKPPEVQMLTPCDLRAYPSAPIPGLVTEDSYSLLVGAGDSGKSVLALAVAVCSQFGLQGLPVFSSTRRLRWMYCDWERSREFHRRRLTRVLNGLEAPNNGSYEIPYMKFERSLPDCARILRGDLDRLQIDAVVIDAAGLASGDDPESAHAALILARALRSLDRMAVVLHHVAKPDQAASGPRRRPSAYGSVYYENEASSAWAMERDDNRDERRHNVLLTHYKSNDDAYAPRQGLQFIWQPDLVRVEAVDPLDVPQFASRTPLRERTRQLLLRNGRMTTKKLWEELRDQGEDDLGFKAVEKMLERWKRGGGLDRDIVKGPGEGKGKPPTETAWWFIPSERDGDGS